MFKIHDPLQLLVAIAQDLPERVVTTMKKGDTLTIAQLYSDIVFLQAAINQLNEEKCSTSTE